MVNSEISSNSKNILVRILIIFGKIILFFRTSRFTYLLDSSADGERSDAGCVVESHLRCRGCADALREVEEGASDRYYAGGQPAGRKKCLGVD